MSDFFSRLPGRTQHLIALGILFVLPFVLFFETTLGGKELQRHDITQWRAGAESIIEYRETYGEEPLWASNMFAGMPAYVVSVQTQVPHLDIIKGWFNSIYPALPFWVMLSGMYVLLIMMGFRPLSAVFGSVIYGLTTYFPVIVIAGHTSKLFALAFIPWIFAGYWLMVKKEKNKLGGLLLFTVAYALEIRSGHPQITYYFMYLLGILWVFDSWDMLKKQAYRNWGVITGLLILGGILGIMGNAERMLTLQEYADYSIRGGSALKETTGLDINYAFAWSQGIAETLTLMIPDLFGGASPNYWGPKSVTSGPHYLGIIAIPFLLIGLIKTGRQIVYIFFGTGILGILFAWGQNFPLLNNLAFDLFPFFSKFRAPETWMVLPVFCFAVVAAFGFEWTIQQIREKELTLKQLYTPLGIAVGIFLALFLYTQSLDYMKPGEVDNIAAQIAQQNQVSPDNPQVRQRAESYVRTEFVETRQKKASDDVLRFGLFLTISIALLYFAVKKKLSLSLSAMILILLSIIDMTMVGKRYMPERNFVNKNVSPESYIESQKRDVDAYIEQSNAENTYPYRVLPLLRNTFSEAIPSYFYPSLGGYTGARLSVSSDILMGQENLLFSGNTGINLELLSLLNTKFIIYQPGLSLPGLRTTFQGERASVYEIENVLPKAFFVDSVITVERSEEAYPYMRPGAIDFTTTAVVEQAEAISYADSMSTAEVMSYTGAEMEIRVKRSKPGFLVISEVYYPEGWVAELNGEEVPIYKTNYMLRGIQVPPGNHELTLDFRPDSFSNGVKLSWLSLFSQLLIAFAFLYTYSKSREQDGE